MNEEYKQNVHDLEKAFKRMVDLPNTFWGTNVSQRLVSRYLDFIEILIRHGSQIQIDYDKETDCHVFKNSGIEIGIACNDTIICPSNRFYELLGKDSPFMRINGESAFGETIQLPRRGNTFKKIVYSYSLHFNLPVILDGYVKMCMEMEDGNVKESITATIPDDYLEILKDSEGNDVCVGGIPLCYIPERNALTGCSYIIKPSLSNCIKPSLLLKQSGGGTKFLYLYGEPWNCHKNSLLWDYDINNPLDKRLLPMTNICYPFITEKDIFEENIIIISKGMTYSVKYAICQVDNLIFEAPLKDVFYRHFTPKDLLQIAHFKLFEDEEFRLVMELHIPVSGGIIMISHSYFKKDFIRNDDSSILINDSCTFPILSSMILQFEDEVAREKREEERKKGEYRLIIENEFEKHYSNYYLDTMTRLTHIADVRCTPQTIIELKDDDVFVFGSKPNGHHKSGAAKAALEKYGAIEGKATGFSGQSYAIPVHKEKTSKMDKAVKEFIAFAKMNPDKRFMVLPVGCGKAGMEVRQVAEMFSYAIWLDNILLPKDFIHALIQNRKENRVIQFTNYPSYYSLRSQWVHKLEHLINRASGDDPRIGKITVKMDCSINEAIDIIVDMCLPLLRLFYPELEYRNPIVKDVFWFKPELSDVSLTINQITDGWYQCIRYALGYNWYAPSLNKEDIVRILKYPLHLYGPYFDVLYYSD